MSHDDGRPAFPLDQTGTLRHAQHITALTGDRSDGAYTDAMLACAGMTLRDYLAARAIDSMVSLCQHGDGSWSDDTVAANCYRLADAMLAARAK